MAPENPNNQLTFVQQFTNIMLKIWIASRTRSMLGRPANSYLG